MTRPRTVRFEVSDDDVHRRLDQLLAAHIPELSRRQARVLIDIGGVFVDRARVKIAGRKLRPGQLVEAHLGGALSRATNAVGQGARARDDAALPAFARVYEDDDIVIVDKPAGLLSAPTPESDRGNLAALLEQGPDAPARIYVVHRLDLQTSGLLVFAKTAVANRVLAARFRTHDIERAYTAVVAGTVDLSAPGQPAAAAAATDSDSEPGPGPTRRTVAVPIQGRRAVTHLQVVEHIGGLATVLEVHLETGRTHQIRIHCTHLGHPVLADPQYGVRAPGEPWPAELQAPRMALHARVLGLAHPRTGARLRFESPLPDELAAWLERLRAASAPPAG